MNSYFFQFHSFKDHDKATMYKILNEVAHGKLLHIGKKFIVEGNPNLTCRLNILLFRSEKTFEEIRERLIGSEKEKIFYVFTQVNEETFRMWHPYQKMTDDSIGFFTGNIRDDGFFTDVNEFPQLIDELLNTKEEKPRITLYEMATPALEEQYIYKLSVDNALKKAREKFLDLKRICKAEISEMERIYEGMTEEDKAYYKEELEYKKLMCKQIKHEI